MGKPGATPIQELQAVLGQYYYEIDEPKTVPFMAKIREAGIIDDGEWKDALRWLDEAMTYQKNVMSEDKNGALMVDADPRNSDWIRILRAQHLTGYRLPHWASLWLWWIGHDREEEAYCSQVARVAKAMGFSQVKERRSSSERE